MTERAHWYREIADRYPVVPKALVVGPAGGPVLRPARVVSSAWFRGFYGGQAFKG